MLFLFILYAIIIIAILFIVSIVFLILFIINSLEKTTNFSKIVSNAKINTQNINNNINKEYSKFITKHFIMTSTELKFYRELKKYIEYYKLNYVVFPEVDLERIIQVRDNNASDRNKIKSRSIDFTLVSKDNCKIICCIELDDYSHNRPDRIKRDLFINELFKSVNIKLIRVKVSPNYDMVKILANIKEVA